MSKYDFNEIIIIGTFQFLSISKVKASTPKSVTCTRTEYREEYILEQNLALVTLELQLMLKYHVEEKALKVLITMIVVKAQL